MSLIDLTSHETRTPCSIQSNGQPLNGLLHLPVGVKSPPVVVIMHGYASSKVGTRGIYEALSSALARVGIAVVRFDFRGCGESGGDFAHLTFQDLVEDAKQMLRFVIKLPEVDASRIGIYGSSMGGALAVLAAHATGHVKSLMLWAPVASGPLWLKDFVLNNPTAIFFRRRAKKRASRGIAINKEFQRQFRRMKAFPLVKGLDGVSILHLHGAKDKTLSLAHQRAYKRACKNRKERTEFLTFEKIGHSPIFQEETTKIFEYAQAWFGEEL